MIKKLVPGAYVAPECDFAEDFPQGMICESPEGITEDFGTIEDFSW
ncbi:MAG: hypothetical protein J6S97_05470 [Bacteroidales bacterium]|nr:hypothetical protein [Bacteroidales bacterium]MBP5520866.1 hypothetical protein [Bacteroidales bacterium]